MAEESPSHPPTERPAPPPRRAEIGDSLGMRVLLPVGRSVWAIAAGYMGLFAVLMVPAPVALILGIVAIVDIKRHPERHGLGRAIFAIVMGAIFSALLLVVLARARGGSS